MRELASDDAISTQIYAWNVACTEPGVFGGCKWLICEMHLVDGRTNLLSVSMFTTTIHQINLLRVPISALTFVRGARTVRTLEILEFFFRCVSCETLLLDYVGEPPDRVFMGREMAQDVSI